MTPEMKQGLLRYYAEQAELSTSHRHRIYNEDMLKFLRGETRVVRYADNQIAKLIHSDTLDMTFDSWQQASEVLNRSVGTLKFMFFKNNPLKFRYLEQN
jgi:hypothetical protein